MKTLTLEQHITELFDSGETGPEAAKVFSEFIALLDRGRIRAAEKIDGEWIVNHWVKQGILLGFRIGRFKQISGGKPLTFFDKHTFPLKKITLADSVRVVPGGTSIRRGAYLAPSVVVMPPAYINVGTYIGANTMIDSHALVGSCAQIGENVHLSAGVQIGGVLEPVNSLPVIIENDVMVGGNCGVYEGVIVKSRAVLGTGVILNSSTPVYDNVRKTIIKRDKNGVLVIPEHAVVIPGSRSLNGVFGKEHTLSVYTPLIVKYRDEKTNAKTALESILR